MLADEKARKGKAHQYGVQLHDRNREANILQLREQLLSKRFRTSSYTSFKIYEPKEREVFRLPFYPDRIVHHAILNLLEPIFTRMFSPHSYSCIKGRGVHAAGRAVRKALQDKSNSEYCLKLDIKKFYPSVNNAILKRLLGRKFKDQQLQWLMDEIIDSSPGLPIGNYLSQYFANYYLTPFDYWIKEDKQARHYFRYADDIVLLSNSKSFLHALLDDIRNYLDSNLKLIVKDNYQVFPVAVRGIDFCGYRYFPTHTLIRKRIKQNFARKVASGADRQTIASYLGWMKHGDCKHLVKKIMHEAV